VRYTIRHRGTPVAIAEADTPEQLGSVIVELLPAFDNVRALARAVWRHPNAPATPRESPLAQELELVDASGAWLPTERIELWVTGPETAVAFVDLDSSFAAAPARLPPRVGEPGSASPEV
jgi:hypothetical protein